MEAEEHIKRVDEDIHDIKNKLDVALPKIDLMYSALIGNKLANDGGLFKRMNDVEDDIIEIREDVEKIKAVKTRQQIYITLLCMATSSILTIIITHFINK